MEDGDTIFAVSSGATPSGVAVLRISGAKCAVIAKSMLGNIPRNREAGLHIIREPVDGQPIDRGIVLYFERPQSFTGDDCLEFHVHGGKAVVEALIHALSGFDGVRLAEPGEFTRRAFENGKLDLTAAEGLSDLIAAQTEEQRKLAFSQSSGSARVVYEGWRERLIRVMAMFAAEIDFVEEDDVPDDVSAAAYGEIDRLVSEISAHLDDHRVGEIINDGYRIAIMGKPNSGKSSLLNALAKRDVAIVTDVAGTTRDVLDVVLDIKGFRVVLSDTAGIRDTADVVELEGIRRARARGDVSDLVVWLKEDVDKPTEPVAGDHREKILTLISKDDQGVHPPGASVSSETGHGLDWLLEEIGRRLSSLSRTT